MIRELWEIIPKKMLIVLLSILVVQILISYTLNFLTQINQRRVNEIDQKTTNLLQEYSTKLTEQEFRGILHLIAIDYLLTKRTKVVPILENLSKYLPKNLLVRSVTVDNLSSQIKIEANVPNWLEYAKIRKYFEAKEDIFPDFKVENISLDAQTLNINLGINFKISPILLQQ